MKFLILILLLIGLNISCKTGPKKDAIYGSWRTIVNAKYQTNGLTDSVVFVRPNSLKIYYVANGKVDDSVLGAFNVNKKKYRAYNRV